MKPLIAVIDSIYDMYLKNSYSNAEDHIIDSVILLIMKDSGLDENHIKYLGEGKILKALDHRAYSYLERLSSDGFWQDTTILPKIYEYLVGRNGNAKEKYGVFYTPDWIVKYMVDNSIKAIIENCHILEDIKILEPACGCGAFLLDLFDVLFDLYSSKTNYSNYDICKSIIENNLYGVDVDNKSLEICRYLLIIKVFMKTSKPYELDFRLYSDDYLMKTSINTDYFHLIIGNPPFLENRNINKYYDKEYLKENYYNATGRFDIYSLFIEKSILHLKQDGYLSFILPGNLLSNNNFSSIRKYILDNTSISNIINLGEGIFEDVGMNMLIIALYKNGENSHNQVMCKSISSSKDKEKDIEFKEFRVIPQTLYNYTLMNVFDIESSYNTFKLREKIYNNSPFKIKDIAEVVAGIATGNIRKKLLTKDKNITYAKKVLEGKDILRYYHEWSGLYFIDDKNLIDRKGGEYANFMRNDMISREKLIIRQTADKFICSYDNEEYYILNTLYSLAIRKEYENILDIKYLLALLNSKLFNFLYGTLIREEGKLFPQLKIFHIQYSPMNIPSKYKQKEIRNVVDAMMLINKEIYANYNKDEANRQECLERRDLLGNILDNMIFNIFGLTTEEIAVINKEIG